VDKGLASLTYHSRLNTDSENSTLAFSCHYDIAHDSSRNATYPLSYHLVTCEDDITDPGHFLRSFPRWRFGTPRRPSCLQERMLLRGLARQRQGSQSSRCIGWYSLSHGAFRTDDDHLPSRGRWQFGYRLLGMRHTLPILGRLSLKIPT